MSAPVTWMHRIVERDPTPLAIPPRPVPVVEFTELPDRLWTYRVTADGVVVGYIRWSADDIWVGRSLGNEHDAATIRRFATRAKAAHWLQQRQRR